MIPTLMHTKIKKRTKYPGAMHAQRNTNHPIAFGVRHAKDTIRGHIAGEKDNLRALKKTSRLVGGRGDGVVW